jgi:serine/threonine protein kinase
MLHDFEGAQALLYVRDGTVIRRLKKQPSSSNVRMKPRDVLLSLQHDNLVRILQISPDGDMHMECMQVSLQRHMPAGHACSDSVKLSVARDVASGLRHLHMRDLQHEDLCPNNILLAWKHGHMHVKLCDFYNEHTGASRTAAYAAPEVVLLHASDVTPAADVWAFACCVLFMEGAEPFAGFEHAAAIYLYLGQHLCVAFQDVCAVHKFALRECAYAPAQHIADSMWAEILASIFVPLELRLSSLQLQLRLDALHAAPKQPAPRAVLKRLNFC